MLENYGIIGGLVLLGFSQIFTLAKGNNGVGKRLEELAKDHVRANERSKQIQSSLESIDRKLGELVNLVRNGRSM